MHYKTRQYPSLEDRYIYCVFPNSRHEIRECFWICKTSGREYADLFPEREGAHFLIVVNIVHLGRFGKKKLNITMRVLYKFFKWMLLTLVLILVSIIGADFLVKRAAKGKLFYSTDDTPFNRVGLLLGTGKFLQNGRINLYYQYRIEAAVRLFRSGKIDVILVSGDNSRKEYNEPSTIKNDLIQQGVPESKIRLDYAGFRTLDSVVRCKAVFGQEKITVISQPFHNERAIFIARNKGMDAIGFNARDVDGRAGWKVQLRERFARVKMLLDMALGKRPKFLGKPEVI